jgi:oligopeptide/dipeptide ABC transporter ATP-binding protein
MPDLHEHGEDSLQAIPGSPPDLFSPPPGCAYHPRCPHAMSVCARVDPGTTVIAGEHEASCWLLHRDAPEPQPEIRDAG